MRTQRAVEYIASETYLATEIRQRKDGKWVVSPCCGIALSARHTYETVGAAKLAVFKERCQAADFSDTTIAEWMEAHGLHGSATV